MNLLIATAACAASAALAAGTFDVTAYGAVGDGKTDDTSAVRAALAAAAAANGGTVLFPPAKTFFTGAMNLTSNVVLDVRGTILATPDSDNGHYALGAQLAWFGVGTAWQAFLHSNGANNLTLQGGGVIDGNGAKWWACGCKGNAQAAPCKGSERPRLLNLIGGDGLVIQDLTFQNSPMWNLRPSHFKNVYMRNLTILAPNGVACNTDGIDMDGVQNALVEDCYIAVGDDAIATVRSAGVLFIQC